MTGEAVVREEEENDEWNSEKTNKMRSINRQGSESRVRRSSRMYYLPEMKRG